MPTRQPTVSVNGTIAYNSPHESSETTLSIALEEVERSDAANVTLAGDETDNVVTPADPATMVIVQTSRPIRVNINGGSTNIMVGRAMLLAADEGAITSITLHNDQLSEPRQVSVSLRFYIGGTYT